MKFATLRNIVVGIAVFALAIFCWWPRRKMPPTIGSANEPR